MVRGWFRFGFGQVVGGGEYSGGGVTSTIGLGSKRVRLYGFLLQLDVANITVTGVVVNSAAKETDDSGTSGNVVLAINGGRLLSKYDYHILAAVTSNPFDESTSSTTPTYVTLLDLHAYPTPKPVDSLDAYYAAVDWSGVLYLSINTSFAVQSRTSCGSVGSLLV